MKSKSVWYIGVLVVGLAILAVSCTSGILPGGQPPLPTATVRLPPYIPHPIEGRSDCLLCHEKGAGGAPQYPSSHIGRPSDVCLACHQPPPGSKVEGVLTTITKPPAETTPTAVSAGELFGIRCAACHGASRQGIPELAPALTPESLAALSDAQVRDTISNGRSDTAMPAFKGSLSPEEVDALLQLIKRTSPEPALTPATPSVAEGKALYDQKCAVCHGPNAEGTAAAPAIAGHNIAATKTQVRNPMETMPAFPMSQLSDHELDEIAEFIAGLGKTEGPME